LKSNITNSDELMAGLDITLIGYRDWIHAETAGVNVRDLHIATHLAKQPGVGKVLFVNRPVSLAEMVVRCKRWRTKTGDVLYSGHNCQLSHMKEYGNLYVLSQFVPDIVTPLVSNRLWWNSIFQRKSVLKNIKLAKEYLTMTDDVLYLFSPLAISSIDTIPHKLFVHDVIDNFAKHNRFSCKERNFVKQAYKRIGCDAGLVTCVSDLASEIFNDMPAKTVIIRNGVDRKWREMTPPRPPEFNDVAGKIVGFGGYITDKLDTDFLISLAEMMPEVTFVIIGKAYDQAVLRALRGKSNIKYLGFRRFEFIPSYYYHLDAALILYKKEKNHDEDPLKLYEYLSVGTPVVSLPLDMGGRKFNGMVKSEGNVCSFVDELLKFLDSDREKLRATCRAALSESDFWDSKANFILESIHDQHSY